MQVIWALLAALAFASSLAAAPGADPAARLPADQQERFHSLAGRLVAPCCWSESAQTHRSPAAEEVRSVLADRIQQGWSDREIIDSFVAEHGERILIVPRGRKANALFWVPLLVLSFGVLAAAGIIVRLARRKKLSPAVEPVESLEITDEDIGW